jgi:RNA exonuclease 1
LSRAGRKSAIVEYGTPERGFGRHASVKVGCQTDDEITEGVLKVTSRPDDGGDGADFVWARLRDMESIRGWNVSKAQRLEAAAAADGPVSSSGASTNAGKSAMPDETVVQETARRTVERMARIYQALGPATLVIIYPGPGDMRGLLHLQEMYQQFKREFKVKKWNELSVQWTDTQEKALRSAFEKARAGWALIDVKE